MERFFGYTSASTAACVGLRRGRSGVAGEWLRLSSKWLFFLLFFALFCVEQVRDSKRKFPCNVAGLRHFSVGGGLSGPQKTSGEAARYLARTTTTGRGHAKLQNIFGLVGYAGLLLELRKESEYIHTHTHTL